MTADRIVPTRWSQLASQGWLVVAACFLTLLILMGTSLYSFGTLVKPLAAEFSVGRAEVSAAFLIYTITAAVLGPFVGGLIAARSIRFIMLVGAALTILGFVLLATATSIWQVYFYFGVLVGAGNLLAGILPCSAVVVNWFNHNRGTALGIALFGASIGGPVFVTLATALEVAVGWRWTSVAFAGIAAAVLPAVIWFFIVDRPPGVPKPVMPEKKARGGFVRELLLDRRLWFSVGLMGFGTAPATAVVQTMHSHVTDVGYAAPTAAMVMAVMTLVAAFSKPIFGRLGDRFGLRWVILLALTLQVLALVTLAGAKVLPLLVFAAVLAGLGYGGLAPLVTLLLSSLFGPQRYAQVAGLLTTILLPFSLIGFPLASFIQDKTGGYAPAYLTFVGFLVVAAISLGLLRLARGEGGAAGRAEPLPENS